MEKLKSKDNLITWIKAQNLSKFLLILPIVMLKFSLWALVGFIFAVLAILFSGEDNSRTLSYEDSADRDLMGLHASAHESFAGDPWQPEAEEALHARSITLYQWLRAEGFQQFALYSRVKTFESAQAKAKRQNKTVSQLNDLYGVRIVVPNTLDAYLAMRKIVERYGSLPHTHKDYIRFPKPSSYQSLHFVAIVDGMPIEFQLRTKAMHDAAETEHEVYKQRMKEVNQREMEYA